MPGGKCADVRTCLDEKGGIVVVSPARNVGSSKFAAAAAVTSGSAVASSVVAMVIAETEPSGRDAVFESRLRLIFALRKKSAPRIQAEERFLMTNAGKENDDPSGSRNKNVNRPSDSRAEPWTSVRDL